MKIAIIDDDSNYLELIRKRVEFVCKKVDPEFKFSISCFSSPFFVIEEEDYFSFDLVLLDIDMPGLNGIELAQMINKRRYSDTIPYIIFVSAMENLVFEALQQFPYSFVRKSNLEDIDKCILNIHKMRKLSPIYGVKIGRTTKFIELNKTMYLEKQGNYVNFYTEEGVFQERSLLDEKYNDLVQFGFVRPHIGALANANYIIEISNEYILMKNGKELPISRSYKKEFKDKYHKWLVRMK